MKSRITWRNRVIDYMRAAANWKKWTILICILAVAQAVLAQGVSGRIVGTVMDQSGAAIANAKITVSNQDTGISTVAVTDSRGDHHANTPNPCNHQKAIAE